MEVKEKNVPLQTKSAAKPSLRVLADARIIIENIVGTSFTPIKSVTDIQVGDTIFGIAAHSRDEVEIKVAERTGTNLIVDKKGKRYRIDEEEQDRIIVYVAPKLVNVQEWGVYSKSELQAVAEYLTSKVEQLSDFDDLCIIAAYSQNETSALEAFNKVTSLHPERFIDEVDGNTPTPGRIIFLNTKSEAVANAIADKFRMPYSLYLAAVFGRSEQVQVKAIDKLAGYAREIWDSNSSKKFLARGPYQLVQICKSSNKDNWTVLSMAADRLAEVFVRPSVNIALKKSLPDIDFHSIFEFVATHANDPKARVDAVKKLKELGYSIGQIRLDGIATHPDESVSLAVVDGLKEELDVLRGITSNHASVRKRIKELISTGAS